MCNYNVPSFSIGYPVVTLGFGFKSYVGYRIRQRKQREVAKENEFYMQLLQQALPQLDESKTSTLPKQQEDSSASGVIEHSSDSTKEQNFASLSITSSVSSSPLQQSTTNAVHNSYNKSAQNNNASHTGNSYKTCFNLFSSLTSNGSLTNHGTTNMSNGIGHSQHNNNALNSGGSSSHKGNRKSLDKDCSRNDNINSNSCKDFSNNLVLPSKNHMPSYLQNNTGSLAGTSYSKSSVADLKSDKELINTSGASCKDKNNGFENSVSSKSIDNNNKSVQSGKHQNNYSNSESTTSLVTGSTKHSNNNLDENSISGSSSCHNSSKEQQHIRSQHKSHQNSNNSNYDVYSNEPTETSEKVKSK